MEARTRSAELGSQELENRLGSGDSQGFRCSSERESWDGAEARACRCGVSSCGVALVIPLR